jgi:DNA-binding transcriptional ArsR family regulator
MAKRKPKEGRRRQTDPFIKAAAHPTRQTILRKLKDKKKLSTIELEKLTGETRYNLYHHLAQLKDAELIDYELEDSRAKRYFLKSGKHSDDTFLQLQSDDPVAAKHIPELLKLLARATSDNLPSNKEIESISVIVRLKKA